MRLPGGQWVLAQESGQYTLTPDTAMYLDSRSPAYLGGAADFLLAPMMAGAYNNIAGAVRKGGTLMSEQGTVAPEHPLWVKYAQAMSPMVTLPAQMMADLVDPTPGSNLKVLDVAAGSGLYGIASPGVIPRPRFLPSIGHRCWRWLPKMRARQASTTATTEFPEAPSRLI